MMTKIIVDSELMAKPSNLVQPAELCDESGHVLGQLTPHLGLSNCEPLEPQVTDEELLRRSTSNEKTYTTAEVLSYLEKL
jgi:hypothetical protein